IIADYRGKTDSAKRMPRPPEIRAAIKYLIRETKKLRDRLKGLDSYSRSLIDEARFLANGPKRDFLQDCENALHELLIALELTRERMPKTYVGAPQKFAKQNLTSELERLFKRFSISLSLQQFDNCLYLVLEAAGETHGIAPDTFTKLSRTTRKRS